MDFSFLWQGLTSITWQQLVMYVIGGLLIYLAIEKGFEPALIRRGESVQRRDRGDPGHYPVAL